MWHAYNLICTGDTLRASTFRKIIKVGQTGSTKSDKVRLNLTLEVSLQNMACIHILMYMQ